MRGIISNAEMIQNIWKDNVSYVLRLHHFVGIWASEDASVSGKALETLLTDTEG